jgi:L-2,4-diaminobutyrate decarboxylase
MNSTNSSSDAARRRVQDAYDPELLRTAGHLLIDRLAEHLCKVEAGVGPVLPWRHPAENIRLARELLQTAPSGISRAELITRFGQLAETMLQWGHNLHHPHYIGHQVAAPVPIAGLWDALGSITNQAMAVYDMGPWATAAEWALVDELGRRIGWAEGMYSGLVTHGGSLANLTALLTARNVALADSWRQGMLSSERQPVLVAQADAHYSVARTAGILGLGTQQVKRVGLDARRRMDPQKLDDLLGDLKRRGHPIIAVSACACSTPIGAFDPLAEVADVCRRHDVWLHVDAAHGGAACLSPRYRHLVAGLERADSLIWDAHKMLFVPALCAFVFYRDGNNRFDAFQQDAPYLFDPTAPGLADFDSGLRTVECTKRAAAFGLWGAWSLFGPQFFTDLVETTFDLGRSFYEKLRAEPDFLPLHEPQCNIVVFRHVPAKLRDAPADALGRYQLDLRRKLIESGQFYIVSTQIDGVGALRVTIINPLTTAGHLDELLNAIREAGKEIQT